MTATASPVTDDAARTPHAPDAGFEPVGVVPRYPEPRATIDPDTSKGWVRRVLPVVLSHPGLLAVSLGAAFVALLANVTVPIVVRAAIDQGLIGETTFAADVLGGQPDKAGLQLYVAILVALAVTRGLMAATYRYGLYKMAYVIETDLRSIIYRHLTRLSFSFYDRIQSGQVISRANSDIRSVQMFLAFAPLMAMTLLTFALAFGFMLTVSVPLTLVAIAALPAVYGLGARLRNLVFPLSWIVQSRLADLATIVDENVNGVRVVKSFAAEEHQIGLLSRAARRLQWATVKMADIRANYAPLMENLPRIGLVAVLLYGGNLVISGEIQLGTLVAFNAYILMLQAPFRMLGFFLMLGQRAAASAERIYEILDEVPEISDRPGATDLVQPTGRIVFDDVSFGYADGPDVLSHLNLTIEPGETLAIVGRTGSGKSTVARLLTRFYDVRSGAVRIDGNDVRDLTVTSLRAHVGVVLDEPFLFSVPVRDNISYGRPDATREAIEAAADAAHASEFIERLPEGYDTVVGERGYTLSGGQRQRIAIARTLLVNPRLLVLDDATSAIDVGVESTIHDALRTLLADRTTIVIAHRLSTISLADRVVLLEDGCIAADGTHEELMATEPRYADVLAHAAEGAGETVAGDAESASDDEDDLSYRRRIAMSVAPSGGLGGAMGGPTGGVPGGMGG